MRKRMAVILLAVFVLTLGAAVAVGGSSGDPLVTLSYLENQYLPDLGELLQKRAADGTGAVYEDAVSKLDALGEAHLKAVEDSRSVYTPMDLDQGDSLDLTEGSSLVLYSGVGKVTAGVLADVTDGSKAELGGLLAPAHRYIVTSPGKATVQLLQKGKVGWQGEGTVRKNTGKFLPFTDVREDDWFHDAVFFVYDRGYFSGVAVDVFSPNTSMNRAMLATVLYRAAGSGEVTETEEFSDVPAGQWYSKGIAWASQNGVVNGMGGGLYQPNTDVTREQMVTMLYRYQKDYLGEAVEEKGDLSRFPDVDRISPWAEDAMVWAVGKGLINGRNTGDLDPLGTATRAEVATVLQRFIGQGGEG